MIIDVLCAILALYGFWVGYNRGIIKTVLTVMSIMFGMMAAAKFSPTVSKMLQSWFEGANSLMFLAAVVLTFILTLALFRLLANGLEGMLEAVNINFINQIMGGGLSMLFFLFIYSLLVRFASNSKLIDPQTEEDSITYSILQPIPDAAWTVGKSVWPIFKDFYYYAVDVMDAIDNKVERQEEDTFFDIEEEDETAESEEIQF